MRADVSGPVSLGAVAAALAVACACQYLILARGFLWPYTDGDQLVIAEMAAYFAAGAFPEPFFWGQNYLLPIEAYLSAPLVLAGVRADVATLLVAGALFYGPFLLAGRLLAGRHPPAAIAAVATPLFLSPHFLLVALMPRLIGAVGLSALAALVFLHSTQHPMRVACAFVVGLCAAAYPPSALVAPALLLRPLTLRTHLTYAAALGTGWALIALTGRWFYADPQLVVHPQPDTTLGLGILLASLGNPQVAVALVRAAVSLQLVAFVYFAMAPAYRPLRTPRFWFALLALLLMIGAMLASGKIADAYESVFFSGSRFWLALPFALVCFNAYLAGGPMRAMQPAATPSPAWAVALLLCAAASLYVTHDWLTRYARREFERPRPVAAGFRQDAVDWCRRQATSIEPGRYYGVIEGRNDVLAYGCFPFAGVLVTQTEYERRTWFPEVVRGREPRVVRLP